MKLNQNSTQRPVDTSEHTFDNVVGGKAEGGTGKERVYRAIKEGHGQTVRTLCAATGLKSTSTVHNHIKTLQREGRITYAGWVPRNGR